MPNHGARGGREQLDTIRRPGCQRQRQVDIATTGRMVVDADSVEARVFTPRDECRDVGQRPADRNSESDAEPGHPTHSSIPRCQ
jgi:hypothetical protein